MNCWPTSRGRALELNLRSGARCSRQLQAHYPTPPTLASTLHSPNSTLLTQLAYPYPPLTPVDFINARQADNSAASQLRSMFSYLW